MERKKKKDKLSLLKEFSICSENGSGKTNPQMERIYRDFKYHQQEAREMAWCLKHMGTKKRIRVLSPRALW